MTDEIQIYLDGKYLSATEAVWRLFEYDLTRRDPSVQCYPIHLPGKTMFLSKKIKRTWQMTPSHSLNGILLDQKIKFSTTFYTLRTTKTSWSQKIHQNRMPLYGMIVLRNRNSTACFEERKSILRV